MSGPITTLSFFRYKGLRNKLWAFAMMQFAHKQLQDIEGQEFYRLMGSGKGLGFNPWPDWSVYSLLQTWKSEEDAKRHFVMSKLQQNYEKRTIECCRVYLKTKQAHGLWSDQQPFTKNESTDNHIGPIAVLTRAVIKTSYLRKFWSYVPKTQKRIEGAKGLIYTKGIGEVPFKNMATFSIWHSQEDMMDYAYGSEEHRKAVQMTRELGWYSEELFARFFLYKAVGRWEGSELF